MSSLGVLAASISHEVNQPLAAVVTNADACAIWLSSELPKLEEVCAAVECIAREGTLSCQSGHAAPGKKAGLHSVNIATEIAGVDFATPNAAWVPAVT